MAIPIEQQHLIDELIKAIKWRELCEKSGFDPVTADYACDTLQKLPPTSLHVVRSD